jgi:predicted dehydrogenase
MDYCCYGAVLAEVLLGRPEKVTGVAISTGLKPDLKLEDNAILVLTYPNALATTEASWTQIGKLTSYSTTLYGSEGTVLIDPDHGGSIRLANAEHPDGIELSIPEQPAHLENASTHFLAAMDDPGLEIYPLCEMRHCRESQWILEEGIRSSR